MIDNSFKTTHKKDKFIVDKRHKENPIAPTSNALNLLDNPKNEFRVFQVCEFDSIKVLFHQTGEGNLFSINEKWLDLGKIKIENGEDDSEVGGGLNCMCEEIRKFNFASTDYLLITTGYEGCNGTFCMIIIYLLYDIQKQKLYAFSAFPNPLGFGNFGDVNNDNQLDFIDLEYDSYDEPNPFHVYETDQVEAKLTPLTQNSQGKFVPLKDEKNQPYYALVRFKGGFFATNSAKIVEKHWFR
ncbi:MAG: hypothetical protein MUE81_08820 [Thermoflexibacter sp.]|nr:hypothetical protein [Thermoflexibacter sp.]